LEKDPIISVERYKLLRKLIPYAVIVYAITVFAVLVIYVIDSKVLENTQIVFGDTILQFFGDLNFTITITITFSFALTVYAIFSNKRSKNLVRNFSKYRNEKEYEVWKQKTSSKLTASGKTNGEDK